MLWRFLPSLWRWREIEISTGLAARWPGRGWPAWSENFGSVQTFAVRPMTRKEGFEAGTDGGATTVAVLDVKAWTLPVLTKRPNCSWKFLAIRCPLDVENSMNCWWCCVTMKAALASSARTHTQQQIGDGRLGLFQPQVNKNQTFFGPAILR